MGSRALFVWQQFALLGVGVLVAISSLPFDPASAMAMANRPDSTSGQVADASSHCDG